MEQPHTRARRKKRRRLRPFRVLFALLFVGFIAAGLYSVWQYNQGKELAVGSKPDSGNFSGDPADARQPYIENYLLLGVDDDGSGRSRSDTMLLASWNRETGKVKLVSFMRDIYADIPGYKSYKLNTAYYLGGVQLAKDTISGMFGVPIHHYAVTDFDNFEKLIDIAAPDGVTINVKKEMSEKIGVTLNPGVHDLNGKELLGYARFRADKEGDFGRVARQQEVIGAVKDKVVSLKTLPRLPKLAGAATGYVETDIGGTDGLQKVIRAIVSGGVDIERMTIPAKGTYSFATYPHAGSVMEIDKAANREALGKFLDLPLTETGASAFAD
ncbi:LCP family protein [Edaphobacillus lindanitolerans]|uniref:Regulatory protein MsrR n=1 Tax=Edaphobacillus lindanitolerans TaxID=550447 RepID=A0A1U7PM19_9BACI|nr:LCP family protein [Edaphobacillus lindanitolerans]SIT80892.1 transcriptional attenuator, LytR family [Edaphobacillus lindanitolerans]